MADKKQKPKQKTTVSKKTTRNQTIFPRAEFRVDGNRLGKSSANLAVRIADNKVDCYK